MRHSSTGTTKHLAKLRYDHSVMVFYSLQFAGIADFRCFKTTNSYEQEVNIMPGEHTVLGYQAGIFTCQVEDMLADTTKNTLGFSVISETVFSQQPRVVYIFKCANGNVTFNKLSFCPEKFTMEPELACPFKDFKEIPQKGFHTLELEAEALILNRRK